jgi:hypothetical protein
MLSDLEGATQHMGCTSEVFKTILAQTQTHGIVIPQSGMGTRNPVFKSFQGDEVRGLLVHHSLLRAWVGTVVGGGRAEKEKAVVDKRRPLPFYEKLMDGQTRYLTSIIPAPQEAEIRRIAICG